MDFSLEMVYYIYSTDMYSVVCSEVIFDVLFLNMRYGIRFRVYANRTLRFILVEYNKKYISI